MKRLSECDCEICEDGPLYDDPILLETSRPEIMFSLAFISLVFFVIGMTAGLHLGRTDIRKSMAVYCESSIVFSIGDDRYICGKISE